MYLKANWTLSQSINPTIFIADTRSIRPHIHSLQQLNVNALTLSLVLFFKMHTSLPHL